MGRKTTILKTLMRTQILLRTMMTAKGAFLAPRLSSAALIRKVSGAEVTATLLVVWPLMRRTTGLA